MIMSKFHLDEIILNQAFNRSYMVGRHSCLVVALGYFDKLRIMIFCFCNLL